MSAVGVERKISVYIALIMAGAIAIADIHTNGSVEASTSLILGFLGFAGGRQLLKSTLNK